MQAGQCDAGLPAQPNDMHAATGPLLLPCCPRMQCLWLQKQGRITGQGLFLRQSAGRQAYDGHSDILAAVLAQSKLYLAGVSQIDLAGLHHTIDGESQLALTICSPVMRNAADAVERSHAMLMKHTRDTGCDMSYA